MPTSLHEIIKLANKIEKNPSQDVPEIGKQMAMLMDIIVKLEQRQRRTEEPLDLLSNKIRQISAAVNAFRRSRGQPSIKSAKDTDTHKASSTLPGPAIVTPS
jgi:hypothetical protein